MKQVLKVRSVVRKGTYVCEDDTGKRSTIETTLSLQKGQSILVKNGIVVGIVQTQSPQVYEV